MKTSIIHPLSDVKTSSIGAGTKIWQFCIVFEGAQVGTDCNICANVLIESDVVLGNNVTVKSGVQLWDGLRVGNDVFIGPNATFGNDLFPRSKVHPKVFLKTIIENFASIGANATVLPGVTIGAGAMIGAGTVVTRNIPPNAIVCGNPGRIVGYTNTRSISNSENENKNNAECSSEISKIKLGVGEACLQSLPIYKDIRGTLSAGEFSKHIPFNPKRYFLVYNVPNKEIRGEHAHRLCHQFLICVSGSCSVLIDDGEERVEVLLNSSNEGLYIPAMIWGVQFKYSTDAVLLVFASDFYDEYDYIRDYSDFQREAKSQKFR